MRMTFTVRVEESLREALARRAAARGKSLSQLVREILEEALKERPLRERAGQLRGRVDLSRGEPETWREHLRQRNWRP